MTDARRHLFYGDLNCPFCFVQSERIQTMGFAHLVQWRGVEHSPHLPSRPADDPHERAAIGEELERLVLRAPRVVIRDPGFRPNTRLALAMLSSVPDEQAGPRARSVLYRALWREGEDISDRGVLTRLLAPFSPDLAGLAAHLERVADSTSTWTHGPFDRRIPSMINVTGETLLGMADEESLRSFVWLAKPDERLLDGCVADDG